MSHYLPRTFEYEPSLFGHPHQQAEPQLTEPFWQQYPSWAQPADEVNTEIYSIPFYYPPITTATMDSQTVYIGSKTKNSRKVSYPSKVTNGHTENNSPSRPKGKVEVYIDNERIRSMPLGTLVRFSKVAAAAFPKPAATKQGEQVTDSQEGNHDWAEDDEKDVDVEKLTAQVEKLSSPSRAEGQASKVTNGAVETATLTEATEGGPAIQSDKKLYLHLNSLWYQPPAEAFRFAFLWMHEAMLARPGEPVLVFGVPKPERLPLEQLVDLYAAALCLDLRPFPHLHRHAIMTRVTVQRPLLADLKYVHEHLPIDDPVMTRIITSYFEHKDKYKSYLKGEVDLIDNYVCEEDPELHRRFSEIGKTREENYRNIRRKQGASRMQRFAEGLDGLADEKPDLRQRGEGEVKVNGVASRPNDRKPENKGKAMKVSKAVGPSQ